MNLTYEINQLTTNPFITQKILSLFSRYITEQKPEEWIDDGIPGGSLTANQGYNQGLDDYKSALLHGLTEGEGKV